MKANQEVLEKLKKILKLAQDAGATPGEVEAAMGKAKALAMRHQIEISSVDLTGNEKRAGGLTIVQNDTLRTRSKYRQPYHGWIARTLEKVFGVKVIWWTASTPGGGLRVTKIDLIGEATDVAISIAVWSYLEDVFPSTLSKAVSAGRLTYCAAHTNGCYLGLHLGIVEANKREEEKLSKEESACWALVVVNKAALVETRMKLAYPDIKTGKSRSQMMSADARDYGKAVGKRINLHQLGSSTAASQLR